MPSNPTTQREASSSELDSLSRDDFIDRMAPLFEGAPRFLARLADARPFGDDNVLFDRARDIAHAMPEGDKLELIDAHPRLGAPPGSVSAHSYVEQGYDRQAADVHAESSRRRVLVELTRLNAAYEARFGFRYCVFVAGRSREVLLPAIRDALDSDRETEIERALDAVVDIARDRYRKLSPEGAR